MIEWVAEQFCGSLRVSPHPFAGQRQAIFATFYNWDAVAGPLLPNVTAYCVRYLVPQSDYDERQHSNEGRRCQPVRGRARHA